MAGRFPGTPRSTTLSLNTTSPHFHNGFAPFPLLSGFRSPVIFPDASTPYNWKSDYLLASRLVRLAFELPLIIQIARRSHSQPMPNSFHFDCPCQSSWRRRRLSSYPLRPSSTHLFLVRRLCGGRYQPSPPRSTSASPYSPTLLAAS